MGTRQDHIFNLLVIFSDILERNGLRYLISCGTLLGAYREKDILQHDYDADVLVFQEEFDRIASALSRELPEGLEFVNVYSYIGIIDEVHDWIHLDILQYEFANGHFWLSKQRRENSIWKQKINEQIRAENVVGKFSMHDILPLRRMTIRTGQFLAPARPHRLLVAHYGSLGIPNVDCKPSHKYAPVHQNDVTRLRSQISCVYPVRDVLDDKLGLPSVYLLDTLQSMFVALGYSVENQGDHQFGIHLDGVDAFIHLVLRLLDRGIAPKYCIGEQYVYFSDGIGYTIVQVCQEP